MSDFGKIYESSWWGEGVCANTIDWGSSYKSISNCSDASFSYAEASYAKDASDPTPTITGDAGGTFTATPAGLSINSSTGEVTLSSSTINSYTVKYTLSDGTFTTQTLGITAASFSNVYSMDFDGVDDYVDIFDSVTVPTAFQSIGNSNSYSISAWIKTTQNAAAHFYWYSGATIIELRQQQGANSHIPFNFGISYNPSGGHSFLTFGRSNNYATGAELVFSTADVNDGNWHHVAITIDTNDYIFYVDGSTAGSGTFSTATGDCSVSTTTSNMQIGSRSRDSGLKDRNLFDGQMDELSIFNYKLTSGNVTSIYNSGVPNNLNDLTTPPTAWYRMGESGTYKSPQWLLPENSNVDNSRISNYSFEFDGVDDYINCGTDSSLKPTSNYSVSGWFKLDDVTGTKTIISNDNNNGYMVWVSGSSLWFYHYDTGWKTLQSNTVLSADTWYHFCITWELSTTTGRLYINGSEDINSTSFNQVTYLSTPVYIGTYAPSKYFEGYLDEIAVFNTTLSSSDVSSIYNSGTPTTLPSGAVAHWKLGEQATFSTNWTVPDQVGSNDGTSANMTIEDRTGNASNSTSNALSYNMTESDREEDTPS